MKKYTWLLFDADGTLFDFAQAEAVALRKSIESTGHSYQPDHLTVYRTVNRQLWADFEEGKVTQDDLKVKRFSRFLADANIDSQPEQFSQRYLANLAQGSYLLEEAEETVKRLSAEYKLIIITNGVKEVQRSRFERSSIHGYFEEIVVSGEVGVAKPAPEIFDVAFAAMGQPKKAETLIIGDSLSSDITGGHRYGIDTCWYNPQQKERQSNLAITYEISRLPELQEMLTV